MDKHPLLEQKEDPSQASKFNQEAFDAIGDIAIGESTPTPHTRDFCTQSHLVQSARVSFAGLR
jgi:hypothetical protein